MKRNTSCHVVRLILLSSILQQLLKMSAFCPYTRSKMLTPQVNCIVNNALVHAVPNVQQTLLQFVNAVQLRLMHSLLDVAPYLVIDRIKVGAIWRPQSGGMKMDADCSRNCTVPRVHCAGAVLLKDEEIAR